MIQLFLYFSLEQTQPIQITIDILPPSPHFTNIFFFQSYMYVNFYSPVENGIYYYGMVICQFVCLFEYITDKDFHFRDDGK